jgi:hypothetical protein
MLEDLLEQAETIVMPIIGYRVWEVDSANELHSHFWNVRWPVRKKMTSTCRFGFGACQYAAANGDRLAEVQHHCGIYAFRTEDLLNAYLRDADAKSHYFPPNMYTDSHDLVLGTVYLWGKVVECRDGYRAECAYPKGIYQSTWSDVKRAKLENIAKLYGVRYAWREDDIERLRQLPPLRYLTVQRH